VGAGTAPQVPRAAPSGRTARPSAWSGQKVLGMPLPLDGEVATRPAADAATVVASPSGTEAA
jgi:hypothetical protein